MCSIKKIVIEYKKAHNLFLLRSNSEIFLGYRRALTSLSRYSIIEESMLLGKVLELSSTTEIVTAFIKKPHAMFWQSGIFARLKEADIHFPYPPKDKFGQEALCPLSFWDAAAQDPVKLDQEEEHFRHHAIKVIKDIIFPRCRIYDPACSTGKFLSSIAQIYPFADYFASDLSPRMVSLAKRYFPNAFVCNIAELGEIPYYDIIFCRFANHEVVTSPQARGLLLKLSKLLRHKGYLFVFGHTPIAYDIKAFAQDYGLSIISCVGKSDSPAGLFQFYSLQKVK